ncbi:uncharacterized protein At3g49140-like [Diospyros lotus]|uniref:uncharacterized protein At3g49140-like n=1 Tax=Diospyros lotus TaxID=55363 RepID=UPI00224F12AD|nr:uncharacterized protein At3g49140-like [Diospyros lotus]
MLVIEPVTDLRFSACSFDAAVSRRISRFGSVFIPWNKFQRLAQGSYMGRNNFVKNRVRASAEGPSGASWSPTKQNVKPLHYHPFEDIAESDSMQSGEARLTPAETTRTIIEVNSKATVMFSGFFNDEVDENIYWPDLPYVTDECGNIYFQVKNEEDILQSLTADDNLVQVIIGLDTAETPSEIEFSGLSEIDFGIDELDAEDSDVNDEDDDGTEGGESDDYDKGWISILEGKEDQGVSDESLGDWTKLETMHSSHPLYFAKKLAEVVADDPVDFMDQPPVGLVIQGLLRPALVEELSAIKKHLSKSTYESHGASLNEVDKNLEDTVSDLSIINGHRHGPESSQGNLTWAEELECESLGNRTSLYKLEMIKIQLVSAHGHQTIVEEDFTKAKPDSIAHSAAKIVSRLKAGGEKTTQALKSLCWRCKGIQAEEAALIGIDTLGFDLRICSGTQVQTLRFTFNARATSEYSAERQLDDLLFPETHQKLQKRMEAHKTVL